MIARDTSAVTIVAEDVRSPIAVLWWHRLFIDISIQASKLALHVRYAFGADGALVARIAPFGETRLVDAVPTAHEGNGLIRGEHILAADRTVTFGAPFDAFVC